MSVALLAEGVDRNGNEVVTGGQGRNVALLAEGVDRNIFAWSSTSAACVALLAEGVDRNLIRRLFRFAELCRPPRGGRG